MFGLMTVKKHRAIETDIKNINYREISELRKTVKDCRDKVAHLRAENDYLRQFKPADKAGPVKTKKKNRGIISTRKTRNII